MTCAHVLGLIDAGPFAGYPRAHLDAAWQHARQCPTCGPALEAAAALSADLATLPQPTTPPKLTAAVLARIADIESRRAARRAALPPATEAPLRIRDWPAWATVSGGAAAGLAIVLSIALGDEAPIDIPSLRVGGLPLGVFGMPSASIWVGMMAAGLVAYVTGLFAFTRREKDFAITNRS